MFLSFPHTQPDLDRFPPQLRDRQSPQFGASADVLYQSSAKQEFPNYTLANETINLAKERLTRNLVKTGVVQAQSLASQVSISLKIELRLVI